MSGGVSFIELKMDIAQLDVNKYMVTFTNMDKHIPDLIADELNNFFSPPNGFVVFAATRRPDREKPIVMHTRSNV